MAAVNYNPKSYVFFAERIYNKMLQVFENKSMSDGVLFEAQQAIEKYLKHAAILSGIDPDDKHLKTHNF